VDFRGGPDTVTKRETPILTGNRTAILQTVSSNFTNWAIHPFHIFDNKLFAGRTYIESVLEQYAEWNISIRQGGNRIME
jgi:hypothetical protein